MSPGTPVRVLADAHEYEDWFAHVVYNTRFNGQDAFFSVRCAPWRELRLAWGEIADVPTCLECIAAENR